jgi:UDP-glucose 4-epimerase
MHYLVTGGAGFIGSHLCEILLRAGFTISVIDDLSTGQRMNIPKGVELIIGDCGDPTVIRPLIEKVDGVFHLAAIASVEKSRQHWRKTHMTNQTATIALLEAIHKRERGVIPFVYASSAAVYGDPPAEALPLSESVPAVPLTPYGADKYGCELHARVAQHIFKIPTLGLRFFNVYGPRQDPASPYSGVISIFCKKISKGEPVTIFGDGMQTRDFIYVTDVVLCLIAAMKRLENAALPDVQALNVCTGHSTSVTQLADAIAAQGAHPLEVHAAEARMGDIRHSVGNPALTQKWLGVKAGVSLEEGLKKTLAWMAAH